MADVPGRKPLDLRHVPSGFLRNTNPLERPTGASLASMMTMLAPAASASLRRGPNFRHFLLQSDTIIDLQAGYVVEGQGGLTSSPVCSVKRDDLNLLARAQQAYLGFWL